MFLLLSSFWRQIALRDDNHSPIRDEFVHSTRYFFSHVGAIFIQVFCSENYKSTFEILCHSKTVLETQYHCHNSRTTLVVQCMQRFYTQLPSEAFPRVSQTWLLRCRFRLLWCELHCKKLFLCSTQTINCRKELSWLIWDVALSASLSDLLFLST